VITGNTQNLFGQKKEVIVSNYLARHPKARKKIATVDKDKGKSATTYLYYLDSAIDPKYGKLSIVLAVPKTGRTHQIRVHLSNLGFPIIGDLLYGKKEASRMFLHAFKIKIRGLDGKPMEFEAGIPEEFRKMGFDFEKVFKKIKGIPKEDKF
jgi:23S rRNA pseudouridine1911/1915/1917 synthase